MSTHESTEPFAGWSSELLAEFDANTRNGAVGMELLDENKHARVWTICIPPGGRCSAHRHVLDYFWICTSGGLARSHFEDGSTRFPEYGVGQYAALWFDEGGSLMHDLENIGDEDLTFITVEYLASANDPLALD
jgi:beta-alanine degradation protein BauB